MTDALNKLIEAVGAGVMTNDDIHQAPIPFECEYLVKYSYHGSLDAAKALHDSLLPGWGYAASPQYAIVIHPKEHDRDKDAHSTDNPARAWLIAILKAKDAETQ